MEGKMESKAKNTKTFSPHLETEKQLDETGIWVAGPEPGPLQGPQHPCPSVRSVTGKQNQGAGPREAVGPT